jgi:cytochrome P450
MTGTESLFEKYIHLAPELIADPYPLLAQLRSESPVYWSDTVQGWVLTGYEEAAAVLRDASMSSNRHTDARTLLPPEAREEMRFVREHTSLMMGTSDPPKHTRLRALVNKAFTPSMVEGMRFRIQEIANGLLDTVIANGKMDLIRDFAYPLPMLVISEIIGLPAQDRDRFKQWSSDWISFIAAGRPTAEQARQAQASMQAMSEYFNHLIEERIQSDGQRHDLLSALVAVEQEGSSLSEPELLAMCNSLLAGGHETTTNLIGNGFLALLQNPEQLDALRREKESVPTAVEELLRYDSPVQRVERFATHDVELGGHVVRADERIWVMLGAANRDPMRYAEPDVLDVRRKPNPHLAFALGIHFCVGAPLARLEGQIAMTTLLERLPGARLAGPLQWRPMFAHRGLTALPVAF